jgi:hypothetical protein
MRDDLLRTIRDAGQDIHEARFADGTRLLVLPHGGRVLGLFGPHCEENFFWTNPDLGDVGAARALFASPGWHNPGGERTWLAPEIDFFLPDYPRLDAYAQPRDLDAGTYACEGGGGRLVLRNEVRASLSRAKIGVTVAICKEIGPAPDPLRHERGASLPAGAEYAGFALRTTVAVTERRGSGEARVGAWTLLQLPHGGTLFVSTHARTAPRVCFGKLDAGDLAVGERMLAWRMRAAGEHKIAVRAVAAAGRAGYLRETRDGACLVVRNFAVDPSGEYVDVPWDDPGDLGYAFQACSINSALGAFSELEHHAPAAGIDGASSDDVSQVWAYRGPADAIRAIAARLLGPLPAAGGTPSC